MLQLLIVQKDGLQRSEIRPTSMSYYWSPPVSFYTALLGQRWRRYLRRKLNLRISGNRRPVEVPMPESKSGIIAANVTMKSIRLFRLLLQFWGSSGESVGCGHSTFVPSSESLSFAATASPNSILASLWYKYDEVSGKRRMDHREDWVLTQDRWRGVQLVVRGKTRGRFPHRERRWRRCRCCRVSQTTCWPVERYLSEKYGPVFDWEFFAPITCSCSLGHEWNRKQMVSILWCQERGHK